MRFVVVMHCLNGMPQGEVASELGLARGTVAVYLHSARQLLKKSLGLAPARHIDQPLVRVAARVAGPASEFGEPGVAADPLARSLRAAESWLRAGLAADDATVSAIGAAVTAGATGGTSGRRTGRWRRWRERISTSTADAATGEDEDEDDG
jgi:Sigma-70, region 4